MRAPLLAAAGLAVLALPAAAAGTTGPFAGVVRADQTRTHGYDNNPSNRPCLAITTNYRVTITHLPTTDVLTLGIDGLGATTSSGGTATLAFTRGVCARFTIRVTGTSVADLAAYTVTVVSGPLAGVGPALG